MWVQTYDDITWPANVLKRNKNKNKKQSREGRLKNVDRVSTLMPDDFLPSFVVVFTWERMLPPWPNRENEEVQFWFVISESQVL